jgi:protein involved in polysaccharide export with SLBB domain/Flp pilus assembly protein TadD
MSSPFVLGQDKIKDNVGQKPESLLVASLPSGSSQEAPKEQDTAAKVTASTLTAPTGSKIEQEVPNGNNPAEVTNPILATSASPTAAQKKEPITAETQGKIKKILALGLSYYRSGKYEEALSAFQIVLSLDPQNKKAEEYINLAQDKIGQRLLQEEKARQDASQKLVRKRVYDLYAAAIYAIQYNRLDDALKYLQEILELDPRHEGAWRNLVVVRQKLEEREIEGLISRAGEAKIAPEKELVRQEQEKMGSGAIAELYEKEKRKRALLEEAREAAASALKGPAEVGEKEKAERAMIDEERQKRLIEAYSYAQNLLAHGRVEEALAEFKKIDSAEPSYRNTQFYIADIYKAKEIEKREVEPPPYTLGPDDVLEIDVLGHAEFSGQVVVERGGEIILPLLREVIIANGLTKEELNEKIREVLIKYIKDPQIQIVIKSYNSKKWYILGEIGAKGEYPLGKTNLTLMEALYEAGLPLEGVAAMRRVILIKPHKTHPRYRSIDVFALLYYGRLQDNVRIDPGDIIYVPKTVLSKVTIMVGQIFAPLSVARQGMQDVKSFSDAVRAITPLRELVGPDQKTGK